MARGHWDPPATSSTVCGCLQIPLEPHLEKVACLVWQKKQNSHSHESAVKTQELQFEDFIEKGQKEKGASYVRMTST